MRTVEARDVPALTQALADAVAGGEAVLPLPSEPAVRQRLIDGLRPDDTLEVNAALVVPTSGSSGEPKGVMLTADALLASARATIEALGGPGAWWLALPATHIAGLQVIVRALTSDSLVTTDVSTVDGPRRYTALVPTQLSRMLSAEPDTLARFDAVLVGGAAIPAALLDRARAAGIRVVTTYGMSETCGGCVYDGVPLSTVDVSISGDGRISIGGDVLFSGYCRRPELTATALSGDRFHTNDLGRWVDGRLEILGRADDVIISGGENIAPSAVEAALLAVPGVHEAAVLGIPDEEWGQRVEAFVVGADLDPAELREHVATVLGRYSAPRTVTVVDSLPHLPSGKLDRNALHGKEPT